MTNRNDRDADSTGGATEPSSGDAESGTPGRNARLVGSLVNGDHRALARTISRIEDCAPGHRDLVSRLHSQTGDARVIGITGSPGAGKSTLVDKLAAAYRDRRATVGIVAVDLASPYSGGSVLGDRIRMGSTVGDMDVFVRSMSARGRLGGLSTATTDAVHVLDAFGKDVVIVETVGAGQNEVDTVRTADTVAVVVQPGSGDDIQALKAGILEIGDVFVANKADTDGVDRLVAELEEVLHRRDGGGTAPPGFAAGAGRHHGAGSAAGDDAAGTALSDPSADDSPSDADSDGSTWDPRIVTTVAAAGEGIDDLVAAFDAHAGYLRESGAGAERAVSRHVAKIRRLVREDGNALLDAEIRHRGGIEPLAERVRAGETDPYAVAVSIVGPLADCVGGEADRRE